MSLAAAGPPGESRWTSSGTLPPRDAGVEVAPNISCSFTASTGTSPAGVIDGDVRAARHLDMAWRERIELAALRVIEPRRERFGEIDLAELRAPRDAGEIRCEPVF